MGRLLLSCALGACGGIFTGFFDSFDPPTVGSPRSGAVSDVYTWDTEYLLYYDLAEAPPAEPVTCRLRDDHLDTEGPLRVRTDRPLGVPETITHNGAEYRYFGRFSLPDPIGATVSCEGESTLLTRVTNQPKLMVATGGGIALVALLAAAGIAIFLTARRRR